jgi:chromate transporter
MSIRLYRDLFIGFFRSGMLGFGGGPSSIPLVHKEVVERYRWLTDDEFTDILALANTLPGPIATKMSGYIGYRMAGWAGLLIALAATVVPTVIILVTLIGVLSAYRDAPVVEGMLRAIGPIVGVMLLQLTYSFFRQSTLGIGWTLTIVLCIGSLILYQLLHVHPAFLIAALLIWGLASGKLRAKRNKGERSI